MPAIETKTWPENGAAPPVYPYSKWNVFQWFGNIEGIDPSYHLDWPQWRRAFTWYVIRNPMFNFCRFVVGVEDRVIVVTGQEPVFTTFATECVPPRTGIKWSVIRTKGLPPLPFISYSNPKYGTYYIGWMPSGGRLTIEIV